MSRQRNINYYELLGVPEDAAKEKIQSAYRDKLNEIQSHDKFGDQSQGEGDEDLRRELNGKAAELNEAYEVLGDIESRRSHDWYLKKKREAKAGASSGNPSSSSTTQRPSAASRPSPGNTEEEPRPKDLDSSGAANQEPQADKRPPSGQGQRPQPAPATPRRFAPVLWKMAVLVSIAFVVHYFWAMHERRKEAEQEAINEKAQQEKLQQEGQEAEKRNAIKAQKTQQEHELRMRQLAKIFPNSVTSNDEITGWWQAESGWSLFHVTEGKIMFYDFRLNVDERTEHLSFKYAGSIAGFDAGAFTVDWAQFEPNGRDHESKTSQWTEDGFAYYVTAPDFDVLGSTATKMRQRLEMSRNPQGNRMWIKIREGQGPDMGGVDSSIYHRVKMPAVIGKGGVKFREFQAHARESLGRMFPASLTCSQQGFPIVPFPNCARFSAAGSGLVWQPMVAWRELQGG